MKTIQLKRITLVNFKGIRNLSLDFGEKETTIGGANGTGKTTVFDAFTWLLFGKDSKDRKDFDIKTIGSDGKAIERLPHEVSAVLSVDGYDIKLRKEFTEKWTKKRGALEETFDGHEVSCFFDDVPMKVSEYAARISELCPEQTFKLITNPLYFTAQKPDVQRNMLFHIAGELTDEQVAAQNKNKDFEEVIKMLNGKSIDDLKKEIAAKKRTIKSEVESIPARIDERKRNENTPKDWGAIEKAIQTFQEDINKVNAQIAERNKVYDDATKKNAEIMAKISKLQTEIMQRKNELQNTLMSSYYAAKQAFDDAHAKVNALTKEKLGLESRIDILKSNLDSCNKERESLLQEYRKIQSETLVIDESNFVCPTCKRPLELDGIESKKAEMTASFNKNKEDRLTSNKKKGILVKEKIEGLEKEIKGTEQRIYDIEVEIGSITNSDKFGEMPEMPCALTDEGSKYDIVIVDATKKIEALQSELSKDVQAPSCEDLLSKKNEVEEKLRDAKVELSSKDSIEANLKRIEELETEYKTQQKALAELERTEFNVNAFAKAKTQAIEERINNMFRVVKFKLFDTLVNGAEVETCEATVDGVPFSTLNQAMQINAGLDIINTICDKEQIAAPIVIDNRESVTEIDAPEHSQIINLEVHPELKQLTIF